MFNKTEASEFSPQPHRQIVFANMSEDVYNFIQDMAPVARAQEIAENAGLSERELFNNFNDHTVFVLPIAPDESFLKYYQQLFGLRVRPTILVPKTHTGVICADTLQDERVMKQLRELVSLTASIELVSYASTQQFKELGEALKPVSAARGNQLTMPEAVVGRQDSNMGSKSFIRQIYEENLNNKAGFVMPEGRIFPNDLSAAIEYAINIYLHNHSVVVKTNKGHAGAGVLIFREGELPSASETQCRAALTAKLQDSYWTESPIIVEKCIDADKSIGGGFPSVEFLIDENGPHFLYACGMLMTPQGMFQGVEINNQVFSPSLEARMRQAGEFVSQKIAETGYRGYHDLDLIIGTDGILYVDEANMRRTGGTHVHNTARQLFGDDYLHRTSVIAENTYIFTKFQQPDFDHMLSILSPLLYNPETQTGMVVCGSQSLKQNKLAYIIFAPTPAAARNLRQQMVELLG